MRAMSSDVARPTLQVLVSAIHRSSDFDATQADFNVNAASISTPRWAISSPRALSTKGSPKSLAGCEQRGMLTAARRRRRSLELLSTPPPRKPARSLLKCKRIVSSDGFRTDLVDDFLLKL